MSLDVEPRFFREPAAFDVLREIALPELARSRGASRTLRLLCVGAPEEVYSVAMACAEGLWHAAEWRLDILALSPPHDGIYSAEALERDLGWTRRARFFRAHGADWRVASALRGMIRWRGGDLFDALAGHFDVIFCRGVLHHQSDGAQALTLIGLSCALAPDGALFVNPEEAGQSSLAGLQSGEGYAGCLRPRGYAPAPAPVVSMG